MSVSREDNYTGVFDGKVGYGRNPAVVVIDFTLAYTRRVRRFLPKVWCAPWLIRRHCCKPRARPAFR